MENTKQYSSNKCMTMDRMGLERCANPPQSLYVYMSLLRIFSYLKADGVYI